jgi:hypothetical protein
MSGSFELETFPGYPSSLQIGKERPLTSTKSDYFAKFDLGIEKPEQTVSSTRTHEKVGVLRCVAWFAWTSRLVPDHGVERAAPLR